MMNKERIDELAFQSGITQHSFSDPKHPDLDGFIVSQEKLDKFAELIIRECLGDQKERIATRYQGSDYDRAVGYGMEIVYYDIVEKFRVE
jgi:hypothetical protein